MQEIERRNWKLIGIVDQVEGGLSKRNTGNSKLSIVHALRENKLGKDKHLSGWGERTGQLMGSRLKDGILVMNQSTWRFF